MMNALRFLALASFSAVLVGCGTFCPPPGQPGPEGETACWYTMMVTDLSPDRGEVTATISKRVEPHASGDKIDYSKQFTFHVRELDLLVKTNQIQKGSEYVFISERGSWLEVFVPAAH